MTGQIDLLGICTIFVFEPCIKMYSCTFSRRYPFSDSGDTRSLFFEGGEDFRYDSAGAFYFIIPKYHFQCFQHIPVLF